MLIFDFSSSEKLGEENSILKRGPVEMLLAPFFNFIWRKICLVLFKVEKKALFLEIKGINEDHIFGEALEM